MQAALTCADQGHSVVLCEKSSRLGGVLRCEEHVDFKQKLDFYLNQQSKLIEENPSIEVRLGTQVTPETAAAENADVIIAAVGAEQIKPSIPGIDGKNVIGAVEAYNALDRVGKHVAILGAGLVGIELGLHLAANGRNVTVIEMTDHINDGGNFLHMLGLKTEINKRGLNVNLNTRAKEITEDGILCETPNGDMKFSADTVIYAVGMKSLRDEVKALNYCAPEFYAIGDCVAPKNITAATTAGYMTGKNLGRI